jgi:hypothetical protein
MKSEFNGASTLSEIKKMMAEQQNVSSRNEDFLAKAEERFGRSKLSSSVSIALGLK